MESDEKASDAPDDRSEPVQNLDCGEV